MSILDVEKLLSRKNTVSVSIELNKERLAQVQPQ